MKPIWVVLKKNWINLKYANLVIGSMLTLEGKIKLGLAWYLRIILIPSKAGASPTPITVGLLNRLTVALSVVAPWASLLAEWYRICLPLQEMTPGDSLSGSGRSPGDRSDNPLQYSCLGNPVDRGPWRATVHGVTRSRTRLSDSISGAP